MKTIVIVLTLFFVGCAGHGDDVRPATADQQGDIQETLSASALTGIGGHLIEARGAFSCDFAFDATKATEPLGVEIERDRIFLQKEVLTKTLPKTPGMIQKHIPYTPPTDSTPAYAGGRYLFEGRAQAATYSNYINHTYTYPGTTQFLQRAEFSGPECRDWSVLVAWEFAPIETHTAFRTERFDTGATSLAQELVIAGKLLLLAPSILADAQSRGYAEVQLVQSLADHKVQLVYFVSRMSGPDPYLPDVVALGKIASDPTLGSRIVSDVGLTRVLDRSSLVLTVWLPFALGDHGTASLWPNSPPIPAPSCGDGLCTPSRGESGSTCPADCTPQCGDNTCQDGEDMQHCPSDCGHPFL
jgi:hypothetical protein